MQVTLNPTGCCPTYYRTGLREHHLIIRPGNVFIYPSGYEMMCVQPAGVFKAILVQLDGPLISQLLPGRETLDTRVISPQHSITEEHIAALLRAMRDEMRPVARHAGFMLSRCHLHWPATL